MASSPHILDSFFWGVYSVSFVSFVDLFKEPIFGFTVFSKFSIVSLISIVIYHFLPSCLLWLLPLISSSYCLQWNYWNLNFYIGVFISSKFPRSTTLLASGWSFSMLYLHFHSSQSNFNFPSNFFFDSLVI